ncbi:S-layer protein [Anaerocolumna sp. AGMB13025]|uniref:S-layer protein n=1 Tax=Anaerocolumna sp. AGMB13025 TaxID=3039116 RepID=UPI00241CAA32|nr:S-layer protein [Anaerocolumna sp. AGMB13025]WFR59915.1 S-layer protein [Anaerocolumna sp. AGMB13025]
MKKRVLALALTAVMSLSLIACGKSNTGGDKTGGDTGKGTTETQQTGGTEQTSGTEQTGDTDNQQKSPQDFKTFKIGVCEPQAIDEVVIRRDYYENYLAKKYNVEFVFSEQVKDTDDELSFIENCADLGADAIISYRSEDANQMAQVCKEYGMAYVINNQRSPLVEDAFTGGYENFTGSFAADQPYVGSLFKDWLTKNASDDGSEGFLITSSLAYKGNTQHSECTEAALSALQEKYGLTYEDTIKNLAVASAPIEVANDKNIKIYIYPGVSSQNEGWLAGVSTALQTGNYGVFIQSGQSFTETAVVVDEVEKAFKKDIKVASVASISNSLLNAFNTKDAFGNSSINMASVKSTSMVSSMGFVKVYNALTGYSNLNIEASGDPSQVLFRMWAIENPEQMSTLSNWDVAGGNKWIVDYNVIDQTLGIYHPDLTSEGIQAVYDSVNFDEAKSRLE